MMTFHSCRALAIAAAAALAATASVRAQEIEPPSRLPGWSFTPTVTIGTLFDSNVALSSPRADLGETQGDTLVRIQPSGELSMVSARTDFSAGYRGTIRRYNELDALDGYDQRLAVSLRHAVTRRLSFFVRDSYSDVPTTDETELNGVPFRRTGARTNRFAGGVETRLSKLTTLSAQYDHTWSEFDDTDEFLNDGVIQSIGGRLLRRLSDRLAIGADYTISFAVMAERSRELNFQHGGAVVHWTVGPHTKVSATGGFATLYDEQADERRSGPFLNGSIEHTTEYVIVGGNFARQYVPSFGFGGANRNQELTGFVRAPIGRRTYAQGSFTWRHYVPFELESLEADAFWIRSAVGFVAARWARVEGFYIHTRQDTIVTGGEVGRHRVGAQVVLSQPMRIQ